MDGSESTKSTSCSCRFDTKGTPRRRSRAVPANFSAADATHSRRAVCVGVGYRGMLLMLIDTAFFPAEWGERCDRVWSPDRGPSSSSTGCTFRGGAAHCWSGKFRVTSDRTFGVINVRNSWRRQMALGCCRK